jgi:hypothetical protein
MSKKGVLVKFIIFGVVKAIKIKELCINSEPYQLF